MFLSNFYCYGKAYDIIFNEESRIQNYIWCELSLYSVQKQKCSQLLSLDLSLHKVLGSFSLHTIFYYIFHKDFEFLIELGKTKEAVKLFFPFSYTNLCD